MRLLVDLRPSDATYRKILQPTFYTGLVGGPLLVTIGLGMVLWEAFLERSRDPWIYVIGPVVAVLGAVLFVKLWQFSRTPLRSLEVDGSGLRIGRENASTWTLLWTDPKLDLLLTDWRSTSQFSRVPCTLIGDSSEGRIEGGIPREALESIAAQGASAGLTVSRATTRQGDEHIEIKRPR